HRQIHPSDHVHVSRLVKREGDVGRRASKHIGENDDATTPIYFTEPRFDFLAGVIDIVMPSYRDCLDVREFSHNHFRGSDELVSELPMGNDECADHNQTSDLKHVWSSFGSGLRSDP